MKSEKRRSLFVFCLITLATSAPIPAQVVQIGAASGFPGATVQVPVTLAGAADASAALVRLDYDPFALALPSVLPGELLSPAHAIDAHAPEPGRFNVAVYAADGAPPLAGPSGTLLILVFLISSDAAPGDTPITLTAATPALPTSDLIAATGARLGHAVEAGHVTVLSEAGLRSDWLLYE